MLLWQYYSHIRGDFMTIEKVSHKTAHYRVIKTVETVASTPTVMYGVEGFCGDETVTLAALSENRKRIKELVARMNESDLQLCHLCEVVDNFLFESYGIKRKI